MANLPEGARAQTADGHIGAARRELARLIAIDFRTATRPMRERGAQDKKRKTKGNKHTTEMKDFEDKWCSAAPVTTAGGTVLYELHPGLRP